MANIKLPFFRGLVPRRGEQNMEQGQAVKAVNTDLDSGELRPLITPQREKIFPRAGEPGFLSPRPVDPSDPGPLDPTDPGGGGPGPKPPNCVPVVITGGLTNQFFAFIPDDLTFSITVNADASPPVIFHWYIDGVLVAGETGPAITLSPDAFRQIDFSPPPPLDELYGVVQVQAQNPCGIEFSVATVIIENVYTCDAFYNYLVSVNGGALAFEFNTDENFFVQESYQIGPAGSDRIMRPALAQVGDGLQVGGSTAYQLWNMGAVWPRCGGGNNYGLRIFGNQSTTYGPGLMIEGAPGNVIFAHGGGFGTVDSVGEILSLRIDGDVIYTGGTGPIATRRVTISALWSNSLGFGIRIPGGGDVWYGNPLTAGINFLSIGIVGTPYFVRQPGGGAGWSLVVDCAISISSNGQTFARGATASAFLSISASSPSTIVEYVETSRSSVLLGRMTGNLALIAGTNPGFDVEAAYQAYLNNFQGGVP